MLRIQSRSICSSAIRQAGVAGKGKSQGFAKTTTGNRPAPKRITPTTLYKNWPNTVHTAKLNKNAETVVDVPLFNPGNLNACVNNVTYFNGKQTKALRHLGSFKKGQFNELFAKPISLVRQGSTQKLLEELASEASPRIIITGEPGIGKSSLLAQMHACAVEDNQIVVNISYPELFLNGQSDFFLDKESKTYVQPMYLKTLIRKITKANDKAILESVKLSKDYKYIKTTLKGTEEISFKKGDNSLFDLLSASINANLRGTQFNDIITELYSQKKVPVLFSVDNFSRMLTGAFTAYRNSSNEPVHLLELQLGKTIMDLASGDIKLNNNKSRVLFAISGVDRTNRTLPVALGKIPADPYIKRHIYEPKFVEILQKGNVKEFEVPKLSKEDAKSLIQYYIDAKVVTKKEIETKTLDQLTEEKYFLSGNGNPRELLKSLVLTHK